MYVEHSSFETPADKNVSIWRYMDFTKFVWLLDRRSLFFARVDLLDDKFEGSSPRFNVAQREKMGFPKEFTDQFFVKLHERFPKYTAINCWHMNEHESSAMWRIYLKTDEGIAIRSTFQRLTECFLNYPRCIHIGKVKYIDYSTEGFPDMNFLAPFMYKRKSFAHEQEIRALIHEIPEKDSLPQYHTGDPVWEHGLGISVDLDVLISEVRISPKAPAWFAELVKAVTQKYSLDRQVIQSSLSGDPVF
ncbi:MAG: hypothetical protein ABSH28_20920 [Acidobacteriota bacterium]|jgi:hypothetical protein